MATVFNISGSNKNCKMLVHKICVSCTWCRPFLLPSHLRWIPSGTNAVAPEPAHSSSYLQNPATSPYPEPTEFTLYPQPISLKSIVIPSSGSGSIKVNVSKPEFTESGNFLICWATIIFSRSILLDEYPIILIYNVLFSSLSFLLPDDSWKRKMTICVNVFQVTRGKVLSVESASSMFMQTAKKKWDAASRSLGSYVDRSPLRRLRPALGTSCPTRKVSNLLPCMLSIRQYNTFLNYAALWPIAVFSL
jgi:hypothetical protein